MAEIIERPVGDTGSVPIAPSMGPALDATSVPREPGGLDVRVAVIGAWAALVGAAAAFVARLLGALIALFTNVSFYGRFDFVHRGPAGNHLGFLVIVVPVVGALVVGVMARFGSAAIRGHGIPEAMEQVLTNESRIPVRITFLKPLSAALSIGTGGPFGAEGPIIATGGALGSVLGQLLQTTAKERKTLLAAGAAAGMAATFGTPLAAVLLAIELLLFEFDARSFLPVALAAATATAVRIAFDGTHPAFAMPDLPVVGGSVIAAYVAIGAIVGVASIGATRIVYAIEDAFERLPIHWMWWPAIGGVAVGVVGYFAPRTLGVGYDNIEGALSASLAGRTLALLCIAKFLSWSISLGSGTSGGTLAPLLTVGGGLGALIAEGWLRLDPSAQVDPRVAALVGMAAMFAGASRALLTSVVFAFESTRQATALLPILGGGAAGYLLSSLFMRHGIMTERIARRGVHVAFDYAADELARHAVAEVATRAVVTVAADRSVEEVREELAGSPHHGWPVLEEGRVVGVVLRRALDSSDGSRRVRELVDRPPSVVFPDSTLRHAAELMARETVGRLPVVEREAPHRLVGILTRSDVMRAYLRRARETGHRERTLGVAELTARARRSFSA